MDIHVFTPSLALHHLCDRALSVHATEEWNGPGTCQLIIPRDEAKKFPLEGILSIPGIGGGFFIESVRDDTSECTATVTGRGVLQAFGRRILTDAPHIIGSAEDAILDLAQEYGADALPGNLSLIRYGFPQSVDVFPPRGSLLTAIRSIARPAGLGLHLRLDRGAKEFLFSVRGSTEGGHFLSRSLGNLLSVLRVEDRRDYVNRVTVRGRSGQVTVSAADCIRDGFDDSSAPLREYLLFASDVDVSDFSSESDFQAELYQRGVRFLLERRPKTSASIETDAATAQSVIPGEICPLADPLLGRYSGAICTQKSLTADKNGIRHAISLSLVPDSQST